MDKEFKVGGNGVGGDGGPGQHRRRSHFVINGKRLAAARVLASGFTIAQAAKFAGVSRSTINLWLDRPEFNAVLKAYAKEFCDAYIASIPLEGSKDGVGMESVVQERDPELAALLALADETLAATMANEASQPPVPAPAPTPVPVTYPKRRSRDTRELSKSFNKELREKTIFWQDATSS